MAQCGRGRIYADLGWRMRLEPWSCYHVEDLNSETRYHLLQRCFSSPVKLNHKVKASEPRLYSRALDIGPGSKSRTYTTTFLMEAIIWHNGHVNFPHRDLHRYTLVITSTCTAYLPFSTISPSWATLVEAQTPPLSTTRPVYPPVHRHNQ